MCKDDNIQLKQYMFESSIDDLLQTLIIHIMVIHYTVLNYLIQTISRYFMGMKVKHTDYKLLIITSKKKKKKKKNPLRKKTLPIMTMQIWLYQQELITILKYNCKIQN